MGLFDKKEDVLDIQLTQHGKYLVSKGKFKPTYYAFFDDDIVYDSSYAGFTTEEQNAIQDRIEQTPRTKAQYVFTSRNDSVTSLVEMVRTNTTGGLKGKDRYPTVYVPTEENDNSLMSILGNSSIGNSSAPAWNINFLRGKFTQAKIPDPADENEKLTYTPEIELKDVEYETQVKFFNREDVEEISLSASKIHSDGSYVSVKNDYLLVDVREENVDVENDNFEIEVFREAPAGKLTKLHFAKKPTFIKNDILLDEPEDADQQIMLDSTYVEYWFNILFDNEITEDVICDNKPDSDTTGGVFVQESLKCKPPEQGTIVREGVSPGVSPEDEEEC